VLFLLFWYDEYPAMPCLSGVSAFYHLFTILFFNGYAQAVLQDKPGYFSVLDKTMHMTAQAIHK